MDTFQRKKNDLVNEDCMTATTKKNWCIVISCQWGWLVVGARYSLRTMRSSAHIHILEWTTAAPGGNRKHLVHLSHAVQLIPNFFFVICNGCVWLCLSFCTMVEEQLCIKMFTIVSRTLNFMIWMKNSVVWIFLDQVVSEKWSRWSFHGSVAVWVTVAPSIVAYLKMHINSWEYWELRWKIHPSNSYFLYLSLVISFRNQGMSNVFRLTSLFAKHGHLINLKRWFQRCIDIHSCR